MRFGQKKPDRRLLTAQEFLCVEDVTGGLLYSATGYLFGYLQLSGANRRLLNDAERERRARSLTQAVASCGDEPFQILSIPRTVNTAGMIEYLQQQRQRTDSDAKLRLLDGEIASLKNMTQGGTKEPMIIIKCWVRAERGADQVLEKRLRDLRSRLFENGVPSELLDDDGIRYLCRVFANLTDYEPQELAPLAAAPVLTDQAPVLDYDEPHDPNLLLQEITPMGGISFAPRSLTLGATSAAVYGAGRFPAELDYGWALELMNSADAVTSITYFPGDMNILGAALSRSIRQSAADANSESDPRRRKRFEKQAQDADRMLDEVDYNVSPLGHVTILVMPFSDDPLKLPDVSRAVTARWARKRIMLKVMGQVQKQGLMAISPYYPPQPVIDNMLRQIIPLETVMGGDPMTVNIFRDDNGVYFARTTDGGIISLDMLLRGEDRTNGNFVVAGEAGQGKSSAIKSIVMSLYMLGVRVLIIDPEREYMELCRQLNGAWLDVGGGRTMVNPLQLRTVPVDDDAEGAERSLYRGDKNALARHIRTLDIFFHLYLPSLTDMHKAVLRRKVTELYARKGIDWGTDPAKLTPTQYPLMQELYALLEQDGKEDPVCRELAALIYDMAYGTTASLWNGYSDVDTSSDFIVLDTNQLTEDTEEVKRAQYFNCLSLCWQIMSANRDRPVLLVADEAHIILDPAIPQTAMYLRNIAKRGRKYEGMLATVFQSIADTLYPEIRMYGQAILDNATYKLFFGCDGRNLADAAELFRLTEAEQELLGQKIRGRALAIIGRQHVPVEFEIPPYKLALMGRAGGR